MPEIHPTAIVDAKAELADDVSVGPFSIIDPLYAEYDAWPDTVWFRWQSSPDPDLDDMLIYKWTLRTEGGTGALTWTETMLDTAYGFVADTSMETGTYVWWVTAQDLSDSTEDSNVGTLIVGIPSAVSEDEAESPDAFQLMQNYPNPFNPETIITVHIPESVPVRLTVVNAMGQEIRVLVDRRMEPGVHDFIWDGRDGMGRMLPSGVYLCTLRTPSLVFYKKMLYIR